ncbi:MAG: hypothetical protein Q7J47_19285 [Azoarcus sp.]|nr:hypothetical protein [Azoarcus sp.]
MNDTTSGTRHDPPRGFPLATWLIGLPGLACLAGGLTLIVGDFGHFHPILAESGTGIVLVVSAIALLGTAAFPLVLRRLAAADSKHQDQ